MIPSVLQFHSTDTESDTTVFCQRFDLVTENLRGCNGLRVYNAYGSEGLQNVN